MNKSDQYCLDFLRARDRDRYLSVLFAPKDKRAHLAALYAFNVEIAHIRDVVREPMAGEIRLRFWRDAIENGQSESTEGGPVLESLLRTIETHGLPRHIFLRYCDARIFDLYNDPMGSRSDMEGYFGETASSIIQLAVMILDKESALASADAAGHGGVAQGVSGLMRLLPMTSARGQMFIPADLLKAVGADGNDALARNENEAARVHIIEALQALADEHYAAFREAYQHLDKKVLPAFLPLSLIPHDLKAIAKTGASAFKTFGRTRPFKRQWILTRTALSSKFPV